jgi:hypothetical protein
MRAMRPIAARSCRVLALGVVLAARARAQDPGSNATPPPPPAATPEEDRWRFRVEPYLWVPTLEGNGSADDSSEVDLIGDLSAGLPLFLRADFGNSPWACTFDGVYVRWNDDEGSVQTETEVTLVDAGVARKLSDNWELTAGLRWVEIGFDLDIGGASAGETAGWVDPWVGARCEAPIGSGWLLSAAGDVGGFGVGSDFTWQAASLIAWRGSTWRFDFGYRALGVRFDEDDLDTKLVAHGPILGVGVQF